MLEILKSCARSLGMAGTGLALVGATALPTQVLAHGDHAAAKQGQAPVRAESSSNQIIVRDTDTGTLRAATPDEAQALQTKAPAPAPALRRSVALPVALAKSHASGARGARLTDEFMSYSVMVRQPDGSLTTLCFNTQDEAEAALKTAPIAKASTLPTE